jgi:hypothetical protein
VYRFGGRYVMYFTWGDRAGRYQPGMAFSADGVHWERHDEALGIASSPGSWDARALCYPTLLRQGRKLLMFYNGNDMGMDGFGLADIDCDEAVMAGEGAHALG